MKYVTVTLWEHINKSKKGCNNYEDDLTAVVDGVVVVVVVVVVTATVIVVSFLGPGILIS